MSRRDYLKYLGFATAAAITTKKLPPMTKEDYRLLELLLGRLETEIGNKICIIPNYVHDGYYINVYDGKHGTSLNSTIAATIELAVENLKQQSNEQPTKGND